MHVMHVMMLCSPLVRTAAVIRLEEVVGVYSWLPPGHREILALTWLCLMISHTKSFSYVVICGAFTSKLCSRAEQCQCLTALSTSAWIEDINLRDYTDVDGLECSLVGGSRGCFLCRRLRVWLLSGRFMAKFASLGGSSVFLCISHWGGRFSLLLPMAFQAPCVVFRGMGESLRLSSGNCCGSAKYWCGLIHLQYPTAVSRMSILAL